MTLVGQKQVSVEGCTKDPVSLQKKFKPSPSQRMSVSDRMSAESAPKLCTVTRKTLILNQHCALLQMTVYMHC